MALLAILDADAVQNPRAVEPFEQHVVSFEVMRERGIAEAFAFDRGFTRAELTILP